MRNWEAIVEQQFNGLALEPAESAEVIAELAAHLAETCEEFRKQGMTEEEAARRTLSQVEDWQKLSRLIQKARKKENVMTNRVKQFWLPSLLTLFLSMGLLMLIQSLGPNPWIAARRSGWSLIAPVAVIYLPWLFLLPLIGALGAYLSNRAGGSQRAKPKIHLVRGAIERRSRFATFRSTSKCGAVVLLFDRELLARIPESYCRSCLTNCRQSRRKTPPGHSQDQTVALLLGLGIRLSVFRTPAEGRFP